ncbi:hypothetical protein [uncultured Microbacterium sp.]|uniref:hypothetical protein n=1 Tax=uncultured Microbacterium sp. TaxID=191216 RepID=UPI0025E232F8|nr:hypothetical protein [uncultured Microbacterium sp.]
MSKRDDGVTRRLRWTSLLAAVLVFGTGTAAAQAFWRAEKPLSGTVSSGSFTLSTQWVGDWNTWASIFPGETRVTPILRVTETGAAGTTLRWRITPIVTASPNLTTQLFVGSCDSGIAIASGTPYAPSGGYAAGQSVDLCLRATLKTGTDTKLQGTSLTPSITVTGEQVLG